MSSVTYIGILAIGTRSLKIASTVHNHLMRTLPDDVRGVCRINGKNYKWSTIQQYEYHRGFEAK